MDDFKIERSFSKIPQQAQSVTVQVMSQASIRSARFLFKIKIFEIFRK